MICAWDSERGHQSNHKMMGVSPMVRTNKEEKKTCVMIGRVVPSAVVYPRRTLKPFDCEKI